MRRLFTLALLALCPASATAEPAVRVYFGPRAADDEAGVYRGLTRFLESARETLHGSVHEVDHDEVARLLVRKAAEGVDVRLVVEADWWQSEKNTAARRTLSAGKVKVTPDAKKSGLMHNKFFVADGVRVWTGSTNLTDSCLFYNPNSGVRIDDPRVAAAFAEEFAEQLAGRFGKRKRNDVQRPAVELPGGVSVQCRFSPQQDALGPVVDVIDRATKTVDVMCFVFSSRDVSDALVRARQRGVRVRVLLDNQFSSDGSVRRWPFVPAHELLKLGVPVKYDDEESKLHHKVVVADCRAVVAGSFNFSVNAATANDENMLVITGAAVASQYAAEFDRLWSHYPGSPGDAPAAEKGDNDQ